MILPILGRFDLTPFSVDPEPFEDGLVAEIGTSVYFSRSRSFYSISSGGSDRLSIVDWSNLSDPELVDQERIFGYTTNSIAASKNLISVAATPSEYGVDPTRSVIKFFRMQQDGQLLDVGGVSTGFLTDDIAFSLNGKKLFAANEGSPNDDYSVDPLGSVSIIKFNSKSPGLSPVIDVTFPDLDDSSVSLLGSGIRFSGKDGVTNSFGQDAEPEFLAEAGKYLFVTLQENNTVARINLRTNQVEAYIGLGWVDYSQVSVDLNDEDGPLDSEDDPTSVFDPIAGQDVVGLRMADGIAAWEKGKNTYFITANEGDARDYDDYADEERNEDLGYSDVPDRLKLIVDGNDASLALVLGDLDSNPTNDLIFEDTSISTDGTPVSFGSRSLSLFDGITGELIWDSWMTDDIDGTEYNTSLQNIAQFAGIYDDGRSDDKGVEPESVIVLEYQGRRYAVGALERTDAGDKDSEALPDPVTEGGLLVVYDVTDVNNVDFVTFQQVSRSPEGLEIVQAKQNPTGRLLLGVNSEFDSNSVEYLDFGAVLNNGNGAAYLESNYADPIAYNTLTLV